MPDYLVFTLTGNLAAMGGLAGHERRGSDQWPARSAIIGLLGAALGIRRDGDFSSIESLQVSIAVFDQGVPLRDFHTTQTVPRAASKQPQTRAIALQEAGNKVNTVLSTRDYRSSVLFGVAVAGSDLHKLQDALERPVFALYLGRKSCPLGSPLFPLIVETSGPAKALESLVLPHWRKGAIAQVLVSDTPGDANERSAVRHDLATDRKAWHFAARQEHIKAVEIAPGASE